MPGSRGRCRERRATSSTPPHCPVSTPTRSCNGCSASPRRSSSRSAPPRSSSSRRTSLRPSRQEGSVDDLVIKNGRIVDGTGAPAFMGDVSVCDGIITEVGAVGRRARRTIDADGRLVTPGFVDIHTHFDGQVCWDKLVTPSCWHGVTTVVMGNCGVGFAPVRPGTENELVELMESVEDIPGTALHQGIPWGWETFGQYLDAIDTPYALDVGAQLPHVALRHYVMGERCYDDARPEDLAQMAAIARQAFAD